MLYNKKTSTIVPLLLIHLQMILNVVGHVIFILYEFGFTGELHTIEKKKMKRNTFKQHRY